jgi:hypothetical protein
VTAHLFSIVDPFTACEIKKSRRVHVTIFRRSAVEPFDGPLFTKPKELRAKREADEHRAELRRLKQLRDKKGSRDLGKVSLPPQGSGIAWIPKPACYCDLASGHRFAFMTTACWQRSNVSMPTMAANRTVSWY